MVFGLLDTTGYSAELQQKYAGMMISSGRRWSAARPWVLGPTGSGSRSDSARGPGKLIVYDVGGAKVGEAAAQYDAALAQPVPLQFVSGRLYVGRHWVEVH